MTTHSLAYVIGPAIGAAIYQVNPDATWYAGLGMAAVILPGYYALAARMGDRTCGAVEASSVPLPSPAEVALEQLPQASA